MRTTIYTGLVAGFFGLEYQRKGESGAILLHGDDSDESTRIDLIERSVRGEHIELLLHARTYAQGAKFTCSRPILLSEAGMEKWVTRAPGTPLQFNHSLTDLDCGGRCMSADFKHLGGDNYELIEGILLNTPRSVLAALRGNMRKFSLGIDSVLDTILCSYCEKQYLECDHYAGDTIDDVMVKLVYTDPIPVERSAVTYPAVLETGVLGWERLSALFPDKHNNPGEAMKLSAIALALQLGADADEASVLKQITILRADHDKVETLSTELASSQAQVTKLSAELATLQASQQSGELDRQIATLKADARITDAQEQVIRELAEGGHRESALKLAASFSEAPQVVPVGTRQSLAKDDARARQPTTTSTTASDIDWHAMAKELPEHIRQLGGQTLSANPRGFIEANKNTSWAQALGIDWSAASAPRKD